MPQDNVIKLIQPGFFNDTVVTASRATILHKLEKLTADKFVFPDQARGKPLSNMAMKMVFHGR